MKNAYKIEMDEKEIVDCFEGGCTIDEIAMASGRTKYNTVMVLKAAYPAGTIGREWINEQLDA